MSGLDARLRAAHTRADRPALARLYAEAADTAPTADARGFYLTQAYIFALDAGLPEARDYHATLAAMGREG